jgi:hypothetical protein
MPFKELCKESESAHVIAALATDTALPFEDLPFPPQPVINLRIDKQLSTLSVGPRAAVQNHPGKSRSKVSTK